MVGNIWTSRPRILGPVFPLSFPPCNSAVSTMMFPPDVELLRLYGHSPVIDDGQGYLKLPHLDCPIMPVTTSGRPQMWKLYLLSGFTYCIIYFLQCLIVV